MIRGADSEVKRERTHWYSDAPLEIIMQGENCTSNRCTDEFNSIKLMNWYVKDDQVQLSWGKKGGQKKEKWS